MAGLHEFSVQEILNRCIDEQAAGDVLVGHTNRSGDANPPARFQVQEIWNRVFDAANERIRFL
jgi:hypothetical protein